MGDTYSVDNSVDEGPGFTGFGEGGNLRTGDFQGLSIDKSGGNEPLFFGPKTGFGISTPTEKQDVFSRILRWFGNAYKMLDVYNPHDIPSMQGPGTVKMKWGDVPVYIDNGQLNVPADLNNDQKKAVDKQLREHPESFTPMPKDYQYKS